MRYLIALGMFASMNIWAETKWELLKEMFSQYSNDVCNYNLDPLNTSNEYAKRLLQRGKNFRDYVDKCSITVDEALLTGKDIKTLWNDIKELKKDVADLKEKMCCAQEKFCIARNKHKELIQCYQPLHTNENPPLTNTELKLLCYRKINTLVPCIERAILDKECAYKKEYIRLLKHNALTVQKKTDEEYFFEIHQKLNLYDRSSTKPFSCSPIKTGTSRSSRIFSGIRNRCD